MNDLVPLCKNATNRFAFAPFSPVSMQGFDMFSGADHVEAVVLLQRDETPQVAAGSVAVGASAESAVDSSIVDGKN